MHANQSTFKKEKALIGAFSCHCEKSKGLLTALIGKWIKQIEVFHLGDEWPADGGDADAEDGGHPGHVDQPGERGGREADDQLLQDHAADRDHGCRGQGHC